jgi:hypothetical protein
LGFSRVYDKADLARWLKDSDEAPE